METALEFAAYSLGITVFLGLIMVMVLVRDLFFHGRFRVSRPLPTKLSTKSQDIPKQLLKRLRAFLPKSGKARDAVEFEIRHLEYRLKGLEEKAFHEHKDYFLAFQDLEKAWEEWKTLHEELARLSPWKRRHHRRGYDKARKNYQRRQKVVEGEWEKTRIRDQMTLDDMYEQGVIKPDVVETLMAQAEELRRNARKTSKSANGQENGNIQARQGSWNNQLNPSPLANQGSLRQHDFSVPELPKRARRYEDHSFSIQALPGGRLRGQDLSRCAFAEVVFTGLHLYEQCLFISTDLRRITLSREEKPHLFVDCDLRGASLAQSSLSNVIFRQCNLSGTQWRSARMDRVVFEDCQIDNVSWDGVDLSHTVMSEDMFDQADFRGALRLPHNYRAGTETHVEKPGGEVESQQAGGPVGRQADPPSSPQDTPPDRQEPSLPSEILEAQNRLNGTPPEQPGPGGAPDGPEQQPAPDKSQENGPENLHG
ncbi:MAG: pentapeptide repeat-containing protein [Deltaproteobacteria bacterium]|nr:pentapeptide repeat-containing protein [Deltaproteobacteria bacterium]